MLHVTKEPPEVRRTPPIGSLVLRECVGVRLVSNRFVCDCQARKNPAKAGFTDQAHPMSKIVTADDLARLNAQLANELQSLPDCRTVTCPRERSALAATIPIRRCIEYPLPSDP